MAMIVCSTLLVAAGLRAQALPPGNCTLVAFGDSTTAPRKVGGRAVEVYSDLLRRELPAYGIAGTVSNKGVPGNTTGQAMARFERDVLAQKPTLVIVQFGINDAAVDRWKKPPATQPRIPLDQYRKNLLSIIRRLKAAGAKVILMTPNPTRWTAVLRRLYGGPPYDPDDPMGFNALLRDYAAAVREIAASEGVGLVDVYRMFAAYDQRDGQSMDALLLDGMHPNNAGHRLIADALLRLLAAGRFPAPKRNE